MIVLVLMVELYGWVWFNTTGIPTGNMPTTTLYILEDHLWSCFYQESCLYLWVVTTKLFSKCWKTLSTCEKDDKSYPISFNSSTTYVLVRYTDVKGKQHRSVAHDTVVQKRRSAHPSNSCKEHLDPLLKEGQILADAGLNHSMNAATERWASCCSASDTTSASLLLICSSSLTDERRIPWGSRVLCFLMMQKHILTLDAIVLLSCHWQWNSRSWIHLLS